MKRKLSLLVIVVLLLAGCSSYERVMVPPQVQAGKKIAILYFDNLTDDYSLSYEVEQQLVKELGTYYQVIDPVEADWALARLGLRRGENPTPDEAIRLGQLLGVDAVVIGEVSGYFDPITQTPPYNTGKTREDKEGRTMFYWEITQTTQVMVSFTGRVISTRNGNIIYRNRVQGEEVRKREEEIGWFLEGKRPSDWYIPRLNRADLPTVRQGAIKEAIYQFSADLLPTYTWQKVEE